MKRVLSHIPPYFILIAIQLSLLALFYRPFMFDVEGKLICGISDDMYISASYARNLVEGHGLVWFPGAPRVEGFSNPLWVLMLALIHTTPFFEEATLGLFVQIVNAILLVIICVMLWEAARRILEMTIAHWDEAKNNFQGSFLGLVAAPYMSLAYWMASGFEVGLVAALALAGFTLVVARPISTRAALTIGILMGLAFWTRMDGVIYFTGTCVLVLFSKEQRLRNLTVITSVVGLFMGLLFLLRWLYYGDLFPNTYYLKLTGWPLMNRLKEGISQNLPMAPTLLIAWLFLMLPKVRESLGLALKPVAAALLTYSVSVAYSTYAGGDSWGLVAGYDRFSAVGAAFLVLALMLFVRRFGTTKPRLGLVLTGAWVLLLLSVGLTPQKQFLGTLAMRPVVLPEQEFVAYGKALEQVSKPGARILIGPAGAIIYFSHRGGVDLLGKNDPYVARLPVRGWRPGHNKKDESAMFQLYEPEFSRYLPPEKYREEYQLAMYGQHKFYVRKGTPYARWEKLTLGDE